MKKYLFVSMLVLSVPFISNAAWWNPFSWSIWSIFDSNKTIELVSTSTELLLVTGTSTNDTDEKIAPPRMLKPQTSTTSVNVQNSVSVNTPKIINQQSTSSAVASVVSKPSIPQNLVSNIKVSSPKQGDVWYQDNSYTVSWTPYSGDFDHYSVLLSNNVVPSTQGGLPPVSTVNKNYTSVNIDKLYITDNFIQTWVMNASNAGNPVSEQSIRQNFYYVIQAEKTLSKGKVQIVATGKGGVFSILKKNIEIPQIVYCPYSYKCDPISSEYPLNIVSAPKELENALVCPTGYVCSPSSNPQTVPSPTQNVFITNNGTCYTFSVNLNTGATGPDVVALQNFLIGNGFNIPNITSNSVSKGTYDSQTASAVADYQRSQGLPSTGFLGVGTREKINSSCGTQVTNTPAVTPPGVNLLANGQKYLSVNSNQSVTFTYTSHDAQYCTRSGGTSGWAYSGQSPTDSGQGIELPVVLPSGTSVFTITCYGASGYSASDSVTVSVNGSQVVIPPAPTSTTPTVAICQPVTINGITYSLSPCPIAESMTDGQGNKSFSFTINGQGSYGFSVYGYGVGFPTYGILGNEVSGGVIGNKTLNMYFNNDYLSSETASPKTYSGYLPIRIFQGSAGPNDPYINLGITLTVLPGN
jgi:peptidoglycan hydrolase-like protein with peptidoglycan-binding domain